MHHPVVSLYSYGSYPKALLLPFGAVSHGHDGDEGSLARRLHRGVLLLGPVHEHRQQHAEELRRGQDVPRSHRRLGEMRGHGGDEQLHVVAKEEFD